MRLELFEQAAILELLDELRVAFLAFFQNFPERIQAIHVARAVDDDLVKAIQNCTEPRIALRQGRRIWLETNSAIDLFIVVRDAQFEQLGLVAAQIGR